jgi:ribosomal protein S12 methylthiotransferase accessory factor
MCPAALTRPWYASPYTGLFRPCGPVPPRPHDPDVCLWAGTVPGWGPRGEELAVGGAGWDDESAEAAGVGEAVERWLCRPLPRDVLIESCYADWPLDEPAIAPERWVLFHGDQYMEPGFPFPRFRHDRVCRWVCCREVVTGSPYWVPVELVYLQQTGGSLPPLAPSLSTGLSSGLPGQPVLLRGLQEVIERDALVGVWWGRYPLVEYDPIQVIDAVDPALGPRLARPNLTYGCYRLASPFSRHVTLVTLTGADHEGVIFSTGSACRETLAASWAKSFLEAVQGRHYVRYLMADHSQRRMRPQPPKDFAEHAIYYSLYPAELKRTVLSQPVTLATPPVDTVPETLTILMERLGPDRPVLYRLLTPPPLSGESLGRMVLRVLVPGLQPLHGHHGLPFLGGPLWTPCGVEAWGHTPPHPFA